MEARLKFLSLMAVVDITLCGCFLAIFPSNREPPLRDFDTSVAEAGIPTTCRPIAYFSAYCVLFWY